MPEINFRSDLSDRLSLRTGVESREIFTVRRDGESSGFQHGLVDISALMVFKSTANTAASGGYLLRIRNGQTVHRLIQQFTVISYGNGFRVGHRFASDQTFGSDRPTLFRWRYRATGEVPLSGTRVDAGEFYAKLSAETLWLTNQDISELELRFSPVLGFEINRNQGFEFGLDYRMKGVARTTKAHEFWVTAIYFAPLNIIKKRQGE